jgi:Flp pilus assembly protein TadG
MRVTDCPVQTVATGASRPAAQRHPAAASQLHSARRMRGQSLVEFALVLPLMLALVGVTLDFARIYQVWMRLQAVTRDTAEFLATDETFTTPEAAQVEAEKRICTVMVGSDTCPANVRTGTVALAPIALGSDTWSATVPAEYDFQTLFLYPLVRGLTGAEHWTIRTSVTYEVIRWPAQP